MRTGHRAGAGRTIISPALSEGDVCKVLTLYREGHSVQSIARNLKLTTARVRAAVLEAGLMRPSTQAKAARAALLK